MDDEERKKKLQAGKERLAQFQKKKARKKRRKSNTPTLGDNCDGVESSALSGTDSADQSVSSDVQSFSYEESDQGSVGVSDLSSDDTSHVDISFEAKVELKHAADEITRLEEQLFGKQAAIDDLSQENEKLREQLSSQSLNVSATLSGESASVPEVEEDLHRKVKEYELALAQRDDVLKQLSDSLQAEKQGRNSIEEAYSTQTEQLTQQIHQLQGQMQQAGETLQEQTAKQGLTAETLLGAKTQIINLQETLHEKDATLKLLTSKFTDKIEELMNTQEENEQLKKSEAEAKAEAESLKKSEAEAKAIASKLQNELVALEQSTEELVNTQIEFELLKKSEAEVKATAERLQSEVLSLKCSNQELMNVQEQLQINATEAKATTEMLQAELEALQRSNHDLLNTHEQLKQSEALARASAEKLQVELETLKQTHEMLTLSSNEQIAQIDQLKVELDSVARKEIVIPGEVDKTSKKGDSLIGNDRSEKVPSDTKSDSGSGVVDEEKVVPIWMQSEESAVEQEILFFGAEGMPSAPQLVTSALQPMTSASQDVMSASQDMSSASQEVVSASPLELSSTSRGPDFFNLDEVVNSVETKSISPLVHEEEVIPVEVQSEEASVGQGGIFGVDATTSVLAMQDDVCLNTGVVGPSPSVYEGEIIPLEMQLEESSAGGEGIDLMSSQHKVKDMSSKIEPGPYLDHDVQGDRTPVGMQSSDASPNQRVQSDANSNRPVKTLSDYFSPTPQNSVTAVVAVPVETSSDLGSAQMVAGKEPEIAFHTSAPLSHGPAVGNLEVLDQIDNLPKSAFQALPVHDLQNAEISYQDEIRTLKEQLDSARVEKETEIKRLKTECESLRAKLGAPAEESDQVTGSDEQVSITKIPSLATGATYETAGVGESKAALVQRITALEEECRSLKNQLDSTAEGSGLLSDQNHIGASDEAAEIMETNAELMKINEMVENRCLQFEDEIKAWQEECEELKNLNSVLESKQKDLETQCKDLESKCLEAANSLSDSDISCSNLQEKLDVLADRCKQLENEKSQLAASCNNLSDKCNSLETEHQILEGALSEMKCLSSEYQNQCLELQQKCVKFESERNELDNRLKDNSSVKDLANENVDQLKAQLAKAENQLKAFETKHLDLENRNKELETESEKLSDRCKDADTLCKELQTQLDEREGKVQDLKVRGLTLEQHNHELERTCSDLKDEVSQLSSKVSEEQDKLGKLASDLEISEERYNAVINEKDREVETMRADLAQNNAQVIEKEIEVVKLAHDLQVMRENTKGILGEKDRQLESFKAEISQLSGKISERDHLVEKSAQDLQAVESRHLEVLKEKDIEVETLRGDVARMSSELLEKAQQTEQLNTHLNDRERRCNVLQAELEQLQSQLEVVSKEHDKEISEKSQEIEHLREEVGKRWDALQEKQVDIEKREVQVKSLTDEITHYRGQLERLFQGQQAEMENQKEFDKLLEELGSLKQLVYEKECKISEDAEAILRLEKDVENERIRFEQKVEEVEKLEKLVTKTEAEIEKLSKEAAVMEQALLERDRMMTDTGKKMEELSSKVSALEAQLYGREQKISQDAITIETIGKKAEIEAQLTVEKTAEIEILKAKELNTQKEVERLAHEVQTLQQLVKEKEEKITEETALIEKLGKDVDSERKQVLQKSNEVQKLWDEVRAAKFAIQNKDLAIGGHLQTIDILQKEKEQMSQVLNQEHHQNKQLSEVIAEEQNKNRHLSNLLGEKESQTQGHLLEIRSLQDHLDQSLDEITQGQQEIQHYRLQIERLLTEKDTDKLLSTEVEKLSVDVQDYREKLGQLRTEKDATVQELEIVKVERDNYSQRLDQVLAEKERLSNELGSEVQSLKKEVDHYQHDSSDLLEQMSGLNAGHTQEIAMLNEQILGRNDDIDKMRTALEGWSKAYHAMQYNAEQLTIALQQRDSHINQQGNQILQQSTQIQSQSSQIETANQTIQHLEEEKDGLDRQIEHLSHKNLYLSNEVEKLQTNIESLYVQLDRFGKEASSPRFQMQADMYDERIQDLIDQLVHKNLCVDTAELEKVKLADELKAERMKVKANQEMVSALLKSTAEQKAQIKQLHAQVQDLKAEKEEMNCSRLRSESIEAALRAELEKPQVEVEAVSDDSLIPNLQAEVSNLKLDQQTTNATLQALEVERNHLRTEVQRLGAELEKQKSDDQLDVVERIQAQLSASFDTSASSVEMIAENIIVPCEVAPALSERSFIPFEDTDPKHSTRGDITHIETAAQELVAIMDVETIPDTDAVPNVPFHEDVSEDDIIPSEAAPVASAIEDSLAMLNQLSYSNSDAIVMSPSRSNDELIIGEDLTLPFINPEDVEHSTPRPKVPDRLLDNSNYKMLIENLGSEVEKLKKEKNNLESILMKERSVRVAEMVTSNAKIQLLVNDNEAYQVNMAMLRDVTRAARREKDELERRIKGLEFEKKNAVALLKDQGLEEEMEYSVLAESIGSELQRLREEKEHVLGSAQAISSSEQGDSAAEGLGEEKGSDHQEPTISKLKLMLHEMKIEHADLKSQLTGLEYDKWNSESILTAEIRREKAEKDKFRMLAKSLSSELEKRKHERSTLSELSLQEHAGAIVTEAVNRAQVTVLGDDLRVHKDNMFQLKSVVDQCKSDSAALESKILVLESALENAEAKEKVLQNLNQTLSAECDHLKLHLDQLSEKSQDYVADLVTKQTISYAELRLANTDLDAYKLNLAKLKDLLSQSEAQRSQLQRVVNEEIRRQDGMAIEHRTRMSLLASESQAEIAKLRMVLENLSSEHEQLKQKYRSAESSAQRIVAELIAEAVVAVSQLQLELTDVDAYKLNLAKLKQLLSDAEKEIKVMENSVAEQTHKYESLELHSQKEIEGISGECEQLREQLDKQKEKSMEYQTGMRLAEAELGEVAKLRMLLENLSSEHEKLKQQEEHTETSAQRMVAELIAEAVVAVSQLQLELADVEAYKLNLAKLKQLLSDAEREKKVLEKCLDGQRQKYESLEIEWQNQIQRLSSECGHLTEQLDRQNEKAMEHQMHMALNAAESDGKVANLRMLLENLSSEHEKLKQQAEHTETSAQRMVAELIAEAVVAVSQLQLELADVEAYKLNLAKLKQLLSDSEREKETLEKALDGQRQKYESLEIEWQNQIQRLSSECGHLTEQLDRQNEKAMEHQMHMALNAAESDGKVANLRMLLENLSSEHEKLKQQAEHTETSAQRMVAELIAEAVVAVSQLQLELADVDAYKLNLAKLKQLLSDAEREKKVLEKSLEEQRQKYANLDLELQCRIVEHGNECEMLKKQLEQQNECSQDMVADLITKETISSAVLRMANTDTDAFKLNLAKLKDLLDQSEAQRSRLQQVLNEEIRKQDGMASKYQTKMAVVASESQEEIAKLRMLLENLSSEHEQLKQKYQSTESSAQRMVGELIAEAVVAVSQLQLELADVDAYKLNLAKLKQLLSTAEKERKTMEIALEEQLQKFEGLKLEKESKIVAASKESEKEINKLKMLVESLGSECEMLKQLTTKQKEAAQCSVAQVYAEGVVMSSHMRLLQADVEAYKLNLAKMKELLNDSVRECDRKTFKKDTLIFALRKEVDELNSLSQKMKVAFQEEVSDKETELNRLQGDLDDKDGEIETLESKVDKLMFETEHLRKCLPSVNLVLEEAKSDLSVENVITTEQGDSPNDTQQLNESLQDGLAISKEFKKTSTENQSVPMETDNLVTELQDSQTKVLLLTEDNRLLQEDINNLRLEEDTILQTLRKDTDVLTAELQTSRLKCEKLEEALKSSRDRENAINLELQALKVEKEAVHRSSMLEQPEGEDNVIDQLRSELVEKNVALDVEREKLEALQSEIASLRDKCDKLQSDSDGKDAKISELEAKLRNFAEQISELFKQVEDYAAERDVLNAEVSNIRSEKEAAEKIYKDEINKQRQELDLEKEKMQEILVHHDEVIEAVEQEKKKLKIQLGKAAKEKERRKVELSEACAARDEYATTFDNLGQQVSRFQGEVERLEIENESLKSQLKKSEEARADDIKALELKNQSLESNCSEYLQSCNDVQDETVTQKLTLEKQGELVEELTEQLNGLSSENAHLRADMKKLGEDLSTKENDFVALREELAALKRLLEIQEVRSEELVGQLTAGKIDHARSTNDLQSMRDNLSDREDCLTNLLEENEAIKTQLVTYQDQETETDVQASLKELEKKLDELTQELVKVAEEKEELASEVVVIKASKDDYVTSLNTLTEQGHRFKGEVERLEIDNRNLKSVLANSKEDNLKKIEDLINKNSGLSAHVSSLEGTIEKLEQNCNKYLKSCNDLQEENSKQKLEVEKERKLSKDMRGQLDNLCDVQSQNQTLAADLQQLRQDLSVKEEDLVCQQELVEELTNQLEELTGVKAVNETLAADLQQFKEDLTVKEQDLVSLRDQLDELAGSMQAKGGLSEEVLGLQNQLNESQQETQAVQAECEALQARLAAFEADREALSCYASDNDDRIAESQRFKEEKEKLTSQVNDLLEICDKYKQDDSDHAADRQNRGHEVERLEADITSLKADVLTLEEEKKQFKEKCTVLERRRQVEQVKKLGASDLQEAYEDLVNKLVAVEKENKELEEIAHNLKDLCAGFKEENLGLRQSLEESGANISRLEGTLRDFEKEFDHAQEEFVVEIKKMKEKMKLEVESMQSGYDQALENVRRTMDADKESLLKMHENKIEMLVKDHDKELKKLRKEAEENKKGRKSLEASVKDLQDQKSRIIEDLITSREDLNTLKSAYEKDLCEAAEKYEQALLENRAQQDNYADLATVIESMREKHEEACKALEKELKDRAESEKSHLRDQLRKYEIEVSNLHSGLGSELLPDDMYILRTEHERFVADQKANYDAIVFGYDAALTNVNEEHAEEMARLKMENDQLRALADGSILDVEKSKQPVPPYVSFEPERVLSMETIEQQMLENVCPKSVELEVISEVLDTLSAVPDSVSMAGLSSANAKAGSILLSEEPIEPEILKGIASEAQFFEAAPNEGPLLDGGEALASVSDQVPIIAESTASIDSEQVSVAASSEGQDGFNPETLESLMSELVCQELERNRPRSPENSFEEPLVAEQVNAISSELPDQALSDESSSDNREGQVADALEGHSVVAAGGCSEQTIESTTVPNQGPVVLRSLEEGKETPFTETTDGEHSMDALSLQEKLSELKKKLEESDRCITDLEEKLKAKDVETTSRIEQLEKNATVLEVDLREMQAECEQLIEERDTVKVKCEQDVKNLQNEHDTEIQRLKDLMYEYDIKAKELEALNAKHMEELEEMRFELMQENEELETVKGNSLEELLNQERQLRDQYQEELEEVRLELNIQSEEQKQAVEELNEEIEFLKAENKKLQMDISESQEKIRGLEGMLGDAAADVPGDFIPWEDDMQAGEELARSLSPNAEFAGKSILQEVFEMEGVPDSPASPFPDDEIWCQKSLQDEPMEMNLVVEDDSADDLQNQIKELEIKHEFEMKQLTEHLKDMAEIEKMRLRAEIELELRDEKRQYKADLDLELKTQLKAIRQEQEIKFIEELQKSRSEMMRKQDDKIEAIRKKFNEQTLHQESVESSDELEEVVQRLQVENQDLLETRHILLEQLDNAHFLKEAQQEQISSLNSEKDNLEEKVIKLQAHLAKYTGETSFEQAAELDKDEWRIKYDRLLSDHEQLITNVWGQPDSVGAEVIIPKSTELQELWHPQSPRPAHIPARGQSEEDGVDVVSPEQARLPAWGQSEELKTLVPTSPGLEMTCELPMTKETNVTVQKIPKPVESLDMTSPLPQNTEGNFCFEEDFNGVNEPSFFGNDKEAFEGSFESSLEETVHDPVFGQQEEFGYSRVEDQNKRENTRRESSSSPTKLHVEYVSKKPLDSTASPVDNEGQYISEITQTENDAVMDGQKLGEFLSESPTDVVKMRDNMYKYARENETLRSEIEALLTNRDAPVVVELRSKVENLEEEIEALRISYDILAQKYADVCEELRQLKGDVDRTDAEAAEGGFTNDDTGYAGFVPDVLARVDDGVGFVPEAGNDVVCSDETNFVCDPEPEILVVKSFSAPAAETEFVPEKPILNMVDYEILEQKYAEVCEDLKHLKEQMAQLEPEVEFSAENTCVVSDAEDQLVNQREENQEELVPKSNPEPLAAEKDKSVDTGYGSFTPDAEVVATEQEVHELRADLSQFNLRGDNLDSVQEQLPLTQETDVMNGEEICSKDSDKQLQKLQNDFEKYKKDSIQAYNELLSIKSDLDELVAKQSVDLLELEGLRRKCVKLDEANRELSDEVIEKEEDFCLKVAAFEKEMNNLNVTLEEMEDTSNEMKIKVEDLEEENDELKKQIRTLADELGRVCDQNITLQRELDGWASLQEPANPDHIFWPIAGEALAIDEMELGPSHESSGFEGSSMDAPESVMKAISEEVEVSVPGEQLTREDDEEEILPVVPEKDVYQDELCQEEPILPEVIPVEEAIVPELSLSQHAEAPTPGRAEELLLTLPSQKELEANLSLPDGPEEERGAPVLMSTPQKNDGIEKDLQDSLEVSESFITTGQSSQMEDTFATAMTTPRSIESFTGHSDSTGELLKANCMPNFGRSLTDNELSASLQKLSEECEAYKTKQKEMEERMSRCSSPVQELLQTPPTEGTRLFQEEIATLKDEKVELKSLNDGLRDVTDQLRRKIAQLLKKNDDMEIKNMNLEVECEALRTRVNEMEIELDRYFKNNDKLTKKNKDLSLKCNRLETLLADRLSEMKKPKARDGGLAQRRLFSPSKRPSDVTEPSSSTQTQGPEEKPRAGISQDSRLEEPIPSSTKHTDSFEKPISPKLPLDEGDKLQSTQRWVSEHSLNSPTEEREITIPLGGGQESAMSRLDVAQDKYQKDMTRLEDDLKHLEEKLSSSDLDKRLTPNGEQNTVTEPSRFYDELRELRRVMQETKEVYDHENSQLKAALGHERFSHLSDMTRSSVGGRTPQQMLSPRSNASHHDTRPHYNYPVDYLALREKVAKLQNSNHDLIGQLNDQSRRLHEQEKIVQDLKDHLDTSDIVTSEVQQVFTHQLAMLQTQRDFLEKKIQEQRGKDTELADVMGDKLILEETLRREKELLRHIMHEKEVQEVELMRSKLVVEEKERGHRRLQNLLKEKDRLEADLVQQKQTLQDELSSIEGSLISRSGRNRQERDQALNDWQASKGPHYRTSTPAKAPVSLDSTIQSQSALGGVVHSAAGDFDYQHSVLSVDSTRSDQENIRRLRRLRMESELCSERAVERLKSRYDAVRLNKEHSANVIQWRNSRRPNNTYSSF